MRLRGVRLGWAGGVMLACAVAVQGHAAAPEALDGFKAETISAIFSELGAKEMTTEVVQGDPRLTFKLGETTFIIDFFVCDDKVKRCQMLQYAVAYEPDASDTVEKVNRYNHEYVFGKAALDEKEGLLSLRAVIGGSGTTKRQVIEEFGAFVGATEALLEHMKAATVASAPAPSAPAALSLATAPDAGRARARWASMPKNRR